jgi:plastocyanin
MEAAMLSFRAAALALLGVAGTLLAACSLTPPDRAPTPQASDPGLSAEVHQAAQHAVDRLACHAVDGRPFVRMARLAAIGELQALGLPPMDGAADEKAIVVIVGGEMNLIGFGPAFSGWSSSVGFAYRRGRTDQAGIAAYIPESVWRDAPEWQRPDIQPTRTCERLPVASRSPRLGQNCMSRSFTILPRVCGQFSGGPDRVEVRLEDNAFVPMTVTIRAVAEVQWVNYGQEEHTIAGLGWMDPVEMAPGDEWIVAFALGYNTYEYHCTIHPEEMRMQVTVLPFTPGTESPPT